MNYPVAVTAIGSEVSVIVDNEKQRDSELREFYSQGYPLEDIICFELGAKWTFGGYMFVNTPFPARD